MRIYEILSELTFHGSKCTKDCGGHSAGYAWAMQRQARTSCDSNNPSFNKGCEIAKRLAQSPTKVRPKIRDARGKLAPAPQLRKPSRPSAPTKPV